MPYELIEDEAPEENMFISGAKEVGRHAGRTASNLATLGVGLPGDIFSLVNDYIARPAIEKISGKPGVPYEETYLGKAIPTTETHRKNLERLFGENIRPQNKIESFIDNTVEDLSLLMNPSKILQKGFKTGSGLVKNTAKSLGANIAGETISQSTSNEGAGTATKAGALFLLSILDQEAAAKQVGKLYKQAEANLPADAKTNAGSLSKNLDFLENSITKKRPIENLSAPEKFVISQSDKIRNLISNGEISVEQAVAQKRSLNKELSSLYQTVPDRKEQQGVKALAKQLNGFLNTTISEYGKKNPKFYGPYKDADQAFGVLAKSNIVSNWVGQNIAHNPITAGLMHVFGPVAKTASWVVAPYQVGKLTYRITNSPVLSKIYQNATKAAVKEDATAFNKYFKQLDDAIQKEESKDRYEFID